MYGACSGAGAVRREVRAADRGCDGGVSMSIMSSLSRVCLVKPRAWPSGPASPAEPPGVWRPASWLSSESSGCSLFFCCAVLTTTYVHTGKDQ